MSGVKNKCSICNKRISIIEELTAKCKCNKFFCVIHKYPDTHNCSFDYIKENQDILQKKLVKLNSKNIEVY